HSNLQQAIAPFRDSTQTAQFVAALAALGNTNLLYLTNIPPRRFEIGNKRSVDLSVTPGLLPSKDCAADTNKGPWLHPLTAQQAKKACNQPLLWHHPLEVFLRLLGSTTKEDHPTQYDSTILTWLGISFAFALACGFWQSLRKHTLGLAAFLW